MYANNPFAQPQQFGSPNYDEESNPFTAAASQNQQGYK